MLPRLSLDCLTLTDTAPQDMIRAAAAAGFDCVSLWFQQPPIYPLAPVTRENVAECKRLLRDTGIAFHMLEAFELTSETAVDACRPLFELGAELGGKIALCYHNESISTDEAIDALARFSEVAAEFDLGTVVEAIAMGRTATLAQARDLIHASGADAKILFDTWHLMRTGGGAAEVAAIEPALIGYVQINDGSLSNPPADAMAALMEVGGERLYIGTGEFPLAELLRHVPRDIPWGVETPSLSRVAAGRSAEDQGRECMAAMRALLASM
ncbi:MAG: sugar phosphate isomerase/epimerase family protein [Novosphingobium sp.]